MHIHPLLLFSIGLAGALIGRLLFDRWFNHLSLYSMVWGTGLSLFELGWIDYYPLSVEAWMIIGYAWMAFAAGSAILILARKAVGAPAETLGGNLNESIFYLEKRFVVVTTVVLSTIALVGVLLQWLVLIKRFGSITGVLVNAAIIYKLRTSGELTSAVPYLDSLALCATCLAGRYCGLVGRIRLAALLPMLIVLLEGIGAAARAKLLIAMILFLAPYFITKALIKHQKAVGKLRGFVAMAIVGLVLIVGAELVRTARAGLERFYGVTRTLSNQKYLPPTVYLYLSAHPGTFSAYLKDDTVHSFPGYNTFAPIFRILARLGIADQQPLYPKFYNTPIPNNTGTYLRETYVDFGIAGILIVPYVLGMISTILWIRTKQTRRLLPTLMLSHFYVVVALTYLVQVTQLGFWLVSLLASWLIGAFIDRKANRLYLRVPVAKA